jgi:serine/threonine protein kinase
MKTIFDKRYEQEKLLGQGAFSEVWKVMDLQTGVTLALKIYNPTNDTAENGNEMLTHEFALMVNANHKNLLRPLFFAISDNRPYLILPYCQNGNIGRMIGKMTEDEAWKLLRDCASALSYLHAMNPPILHQDIKPANILLGDNGEYMLTDFGVSTQAKQSLSRVSNQDMALFSAGTISYMAPERFSRNNLPIMANDIYSLGSTVYEMLSGMLPFGNDGGLLQKKGAEVPEVPGNFSPLLKQTLEQCLEAEPWQRPTAEKLEEIANNALRHPESRNIQRMKPADIEQNKIQENIKATVIGSSSSLDNMLTNSQDDVSNSTDSIISNSFDNSQPSTSHSRKGLYIGLMIVFLILVGGAAYYFLGYQPTVEESVTISPEEQAKLQEQAEFDHALQMISQNTKDSVQVALNLMKTLADNGNEQAIFEVVRTYTWIPNDKESDHRKQVLDWGVYDSGPLAGAPNSKEINAEAINWLTKSIEMKIPNFYRCQYWLAFYHYYGLGIPDNVSMAKILLESAKVEAEKSQDQEFKVKIEKTLEQF